MEVIWSFFLVVNGRPRLFGKFKKFYKSFYKNSVKRLLTIFILIPYHFFFQSLQLFLNSYRLNLKGIKGRKLP